MTLVVDIPIEKGEVIKNQYEIFNLLGRGGFGAVFEIYDSQRNEVFALKIEIKKPTQDDPGLAVEISALKKLQCNHHFARYIDSGKHGQYMFLVMTLVGRNLSDLRRSCPQSRFTLSTSLRLGYQCLEAIEVMHSVGLLHRDIKPSNYALGLNDTDRRNVYLLDFGLVRRFKLKDGKKRNPRPVAGFRGTVKYASLNCHKRLELGPNDDLCSWCYLLIEFMKGELPWNTENDRNKVGEMKMKMKKQLLENTGLEIQKIYQSIIKLKYADEPPYHWYRELLNNVTQRKHIANSDPFDWEEGGAYYVPSKTAISAAQIKKKTKKSKTKKQKGIVKEPKSEDS